MRDTSETCDCYATKHDSIKPSTDWIFQANGEILFGYNEDLGLYFNNDYLDALIKAIDKRREEREEVANED
jgi:hypothetical protein